MVAYKAAQVPGVLKAPQPRLQAFLLYGPEPGLVSDRAQGLARLLRERETPPGEVVRLDEASLADDSRRLAVELQTVALFGGRNVVRLRAAGRLDARSVEMLIAGPMEAYLIVEAGQLPPRSPLRQAFEKAEHAAALPNYGDADKDMPQLVDAELTARGLSIADDARAALLGQLGTDPALARSEIAKLALYAGATDRIALAHVEAIVGDTREAALDALANAVGDKHEAEALRQFDRLLAGGTGAQAALLTLTRHFAELHRLRAATDAGANIKTLLERARPPLSFAKRDALAAQARQWSQDEAARALRLLEQATAVTRRRPELETHAVERALLELCGRLPAA